MIQEPLPAWPEWADVRDMPGVPALYARRPDLPPRGETVRMLAVRAVLAFGVMSVIGWVVLTVVLLLHPEMGAAAQ